MKRAESDDLETIKDTGSLLRSGQELTSGWREEDVRLWTSERHERASDLE